MKRKKRMKEEEILGKIGDRCDERMMMDTSHGKHARSLPSELDTSLDAIARVSSPRLSSRRRGR